MKMAAKGAEAEIFELERDGRKGMLKRRVKKKYRIEQLDSRIRTLRTRREGKVLHMAKLAGILCPLVYDADLQNAEIFMQKMSGKQLREILADGKMGGKCAKYLYEAGATLGKLHNANIVHGDYQTANIMVTDKDEIALIDFGLADFSNSIEDKATDLLVFKKAVTEAQFKEFIKGYSKVCSNYIHIKPQLAEMEKRGRYVTRAQAS
ncbi:MAG: KEOPS complex kinase/ATPase Bud32 [Candidatus Micrarchaeota archaeon]